jgi:hypothetical protein
MADFLSEQLTALEKRLKDLRPQVEEYLHLEQVKQALEGVGKPRRGPGRPRGSTTRRAARARTDGAVAAGVAARVQPRP